jgi:hypothetical protein
VVVGDPNRLTPDEVNFSLSPPLFIFIFLFMIEFQWHHVCGTWDNKTLNLYVDGKLDKSIDPYAKYFPPHSPFSTPLCLPLLLSSLPGRLLINLLAAIIQKATGARATTVMWAYR